MGMVAYSEPLTCAHPRSSPSTPALVDEDVMHHPLLTSHVAMVRPPRNGLVGVGGAGAGMSTSVGMSITLGQLEAPPSRVSALSKRRPALQQDDEPAPHDPAHAAARRPRARAAWASTLAALAERTSALAERHVVPLASLTVAEVRRASARS